MLIMLMIKKQDKENSICGVEWGWIIRLFLFYSLVHIWIHN